MKIKIDGLECDKNNQSVFMAYMRIEDEGVYEKFRTEYWCEDEFWEWYGRFCSMYFLNNKKPRIKEYKSNEKDDFHIIYYCDDEVDRGIFKDMIQKFEIETTEDIKSTLKKMGLLTD